MNPLIRIIPDQLWSLGAKPLPTLGGYQCHIAVDLGTRDDLASVGTMFPPMSPSKPYYLKQKSLKMSH